MTNVFVQFRTTDGESICGQRHDSDSFDEVWLVSHIRTVHVHPMEEIGRFGLAFGPYDITDLDGEHRFHTKNIVSEGWKTNKVLEEEYFKNLDKGAPKKIEAEEGTNVYTLPFGDREVEEDSD